MRVLRMSVALGLLGIPAALAVSTHQDPGVVHRPPVAQPTKVVAGPAGGEGGRLPPAGRRLRSCREGRWLRPEGAKVELLGNGQVLRATMTDATGLFAFEQVPTGVYEVRASSNGLAPVIMRVAVGSLPGVPLRMAMGVPWEETDEAQSAFRMRGAERLACSKPRQHSARSRSGRERPTADGGEADPPVPPADAFRARLQHRVVRPHR